MNDRPPDRGHTRFQKPAHKDGAGAAARGPTAHAQAPSRPAPPCCLPRARPPPRRRWPSFGKSLRSWVLSLSEGTRSLPSPPAVARGGVHWRPHGRHARFSPGPSFGYDAHASGSAALVPGSTSATFRAGRGPPRAPPPRVRARLPSGLGPPRPGPSHGCVSVRFADGASWFPGATPRASSPARPWGPGAPPAGRSGLGVVRVWDTPPAPAGAAGHVQATASPPEGRLRGGPGRGVYVGVYVCLCVRGHRFPSRGRHAYLPSPAVRGEAPAERRSGCAGTALPPATSAAARAGGGG